MRAAREKERSTTTSLRSEMHERPWQSLLGMEQRTQEFYPKQIPYRLWLSKWRIQLPWCDYNWIISTRCPDVIAQLGKLNCEMKKKGTFQRSNVKQKRWEISRLVIQSLVVVFLFCFVSLTVNHPNWELSLEKYKKIACLILGNTMKCVTLTQNFTEPRLHSFLPCTLVSISVVTWG